MNNNKYLIIFAHPSHDGHNGYFLKKIEEILQAKSCDYEVMDLYKKNFQACLCDDELYTMGRKNISPENLTIQEKIIASNRLIFIYPTWWQNMPAILKGFFDRIITGGFGFKYIKGIPVGLLKTKRPPSLQQAAALGFYEKFLIGAPSIKLVSKHILGFCGIKAKGFMLCSAKNLESNKKKIENFALLVIKYLD